MISELSANKIAITRFPAESCISSVEEVVPREPGGPAAIIISGKFSRRDEQLLASLLPAREMQYDVALGPTTQTARFIGISPAFVDQEARMLINGLQREGFVKGPGERSEQVDEPAPTSHWRASENGRGSNGGSLKVAPRPVGAPGRATGD